MTATGIEIVLGGVPLPLHVRAGGFVYDLEDEGKKPPLPEALDERALTSLDQLDWVWLTPREAQWDPETVELQDVDPGFPSTVNAELVRRGSGRWVLTRGLYVADWVESFATLTDAEWYGQPFALQEWQLRLLAELFIVDPETGLRVFRWSLIGLPKKNGKTELAAALGLYLLDGDGETAPYVIAAAASEDQADLVFGAAKTMAENENLADQLKAYGTEIQRRNEPRTRLKRVAAAAGTNDGKNIHANLIDELHEWTSRKGEQVWNVLTNGLGARREPLIVQITTAGSDEESVCYRMYAHATRIMEEGYDVVDDRTFYGVWFEAPDGLEHTGERYIRAANPSYGVTVFWPFFKDQLSKKTEAVYRRYFGNQWTEAEEIWEAAQLWDDLEGPAQLDPNRPITAAIDIGIKHDSSAVIVLQWQEERGKLVVNSRGDHGRIWQNPHRPGDPRYSAWRLEIAEVENHLRRLYDDFPESRTEDEDEVPLPGPAYPYDPHFFRRSAEDLEGDKLNMLEFPQTDARMVPASQTLFELIKSGKVEHDGDPVLRRHIRSVVAKEKDRGWRISKPHGSRKRIDGAIALAIGAYMEMTLADDVDEGPSLW